MHLGRHHLAFFRGTLDGLSLGQLGDLYLETGSDARQAKHDAVAEHRTIAGQVEYWAKIGRAALDNPDLPVSFVAESLASMAEAREDATPFVPRSRRA